MIEITIYHFLPTVFAFSFGILGGYIGVKKSQIERGFKLERERFVAGLGISFGVSVMLLWVFSDHLLTESTWFLYARRDGLAAGVICYLMMKNTNKQ